MGTKRSEKGGIRGVGRAREARHRIGKIWIKILKEMRGGCDEGGVKASFCYRI